MNARPLRHSLLGNPTDTKTVVRAEKAHPSRGAPVNLDLAVQEQNTTDLEESNLDKKSGAGKGPLRCAQLSNAPNTSPCTLCSTNRILVALSKHTPLIIQPKRFIMEKEQLLDLKS